MRDWKSVLIICIFMAAGGYWLVNMARQGETVAWIIIVSVIVGFLLLIVVGLVLLLVRENRHNFTANAQQDLKIMRQMQSLQNAQLTATLRQAQLDRATSQRQMASLAEQPPQLPALIYEEGIYEDLTLADGE